MSIRNACVVLCVMMAWMSCDDQQFKEVQRIHLSVFAPTGEADSIDLTYTDSGRAQARLQSLKMRDYSAIRFPFTAFPEGVFLTLTDKGGQKTFVKADFAISYKETKLIDLNGHVHIYNLKGQQLHTAQLYYDQQQEWFFTEQPFEFSDPKGSSRGQGIDFSKDFKRIKTHSFSGQATE